MLGIFGKVLHGEPIKTRLQRKWSRAQAESFYLASLTDTLEASVEVEPNPTLFLQGGEDARAVENLRAQLFEHGLVFGVWDRLCVEPQKGRDLGMRLEQAFADLFRHADRGAGALIIGSDSPSLGAGKLRRGLDALGGESGDAPVPDVVLGPTADGGYWAIGMRRAIPGLLERIAWSTDRTLRDTQRRAHQQGLSVRLLESWTDVDHPEDLEELVRQVQQLRSEGDTHTARHTEEVLRALQVME